MNTYQTTNTRRPFRLLRTAFLVIGLGLIAPLAFAQGIVSSGMGGLVRAADGKPVVGAAVTATHLPTGTVYKSVTRGDGRFNVSGMVVGGPYTVSVESPGFKISEKTDVSTQLGTTVDVNIGMEASSVVTMEKFMVESSSTALDSGASGAGNIIGSGGINTTATVQRSFADVARTTPFVSLRGILTSRQQPIITAVGQNNRFNSILVDGARINDQFGLNGSGLQAFGNPISLDTIEQFNISISPYDVSQSGFTGASINAVTKSGTNQFHGSAYYYYTNDDFQGANVFGSTAGTRAFLEQKTKGFTFGGPIWKNRVFFFINYEKFESVSPEVAAYDPTGTPQGVADLAAINTRLAAIKAGVSYGSDLDFGTFIGRTAPIAQFNEIKLAKLDFNISSGQRLSFATTRLRANFPPAHVTPRPISRPPAAQVFPPPRSRPTFPRIASFRSAAKKSGRPSSSASGPRISKRNCVTPGMNIPKTRLPRSSSPKSASSAFPVSPTLASPPALARSRSARSKTATGIISR